MTGRPPTLITTIICPDCGGPKYRYSVYCKACAAKGERNGMHGRKHSEASRQLQSERAPKERPERRADLHPMWKGDAVRKEGGRERARTWYPELQSCRVCGSTKTERHHVDANTRNNDPANVLFLCRPHHRQIHPGHGRVRLYAPADVFPEVFSTP